MESATGSSHHRMEEGAPSAVPSCRGSQTRTCLVGTLPHGATPFLWRPRLGVGSPASPPAVGPADAPRGDRRREGFGGHQRSGTTLRGAGRWLSGRPNLPYPTYGGVASPTRAWARPGAVSSDECRCWYIGLCGTAVSITFLLFLVLLPLARGRCPRPASLSSHHVKMHRRWFRLLESEG